MHFSIHYDNLNSPETQAEAIKDLFDWLSPKQKEGFEELIESDPSLEQFQFYTSLTGASGYPLALYFYLNSPRVDRTQTYTEWVENHA